MEQEIKKALHKFISEELDLDEERLEGFDYDTSLFDNGLDLDSLDAVDIAIFIKKTYRIELSEEDVDAFKNINLIAETVNKKIAELEPA